MSNSAEGSRDPSLRVERGPDTARTVALVRGHQRGRYDLAVTVRTRPPTADGSTGSFGTVVAVIRWHGSSRRRANSAMSANLLPGTWYGRLGLLVIALGLVLMHHVVGAHQHSAPDVAPAAASAHLSAAQSAPTTGGHHHGGDAAAQDGSAGEHGVPSETPDAMPDKGSAALLHHHSDENGHDHAGSLLHMCLVALVGAAVFLLVLVLVALWWWPPPPRLDTETVAPAPTPRAPPASLRQAELQVLRL
ncbi:DUF6153 family protein [Actinomycetospora lutea]|uniref:DUF6153 family protein n=1 Tax=Actinomycetospora lutea TaxID=663604 RepID=UPI002365C583|nr:DUF6153 family protein [Actinomycetospora lutea]MDD7942704.1 DUF6153 family protein [Actinomycetospora lutea]